MEFDWDEHNLFHIAMHGVTRQEVETALLGRTVFVRSELRNNEVRRSLLGAAEEGRILFLVVTQRHQKPRCVTAFPANRPFRKLYASKTGVSP